MKNIEGVVSPSLNKNSDFYFVDYFSKCEFIRELSVDVDESDTSLIGSLLRVHSKV